MEQVSLLKMPAIPNAMCWQALVHRTISGGLYFPLNDLLREPYSRLIQPQTDFETLKVHTLAGNTAGALNGLILNPLTAVKYQCWGHEKSSFWDTAARMARKGGASPFLNGIVPTVARDAIFGGFFAGIKFKLGHSLQGNLSLVVVDLRMSQGADLSMLQRTSRRTSCHHLPV